MTITPSAIGGAAAFGVVFAVTFAGFTLWRRRIPGLAPGPSARAAVYLTRYAAALEYYGMRRREIASSVDDLRGDLGAVDPDDIYTTLRRLGPPRTLAAEVSGGILRPSFLRGQVWFGLGLMLAIASSFLTTEAFLGGFEAVAEQGEQANWSRIGFDAEATMGPDGRASSVGFGGYSLFILPLVGFVIGARLWRLPLRADERSHD